MATLISGNNTAEPRLFISNYNTLVNSSVFFKFELPTSLDKNLKITTLKLYTGDFDVNTKEAIYTKLDLDDTTINLLDNLTYTYKNIGTYNVSYSVKYSNGSEKTFYTDTPITVLKNWPSFNQENIRILGENILTLPYTFEQIQINPNEFGVHSIYNNSIKKLIDCLNYLKSNTRILNSKTPSLYYGWLGLNGSRPSDGLCWHTPDYRKEYYSNITAVPGFSEIRDIAETSSLLYILNKNGFKIYKNSNKLQEVKFDNYSDIFNTFTNIISMDIDSLGKKIYLIDSFQNKLCRIDIDFDSTNSLYETYNPILSLTRIIGSYGDEVDPFTFNNPTQVLFNNNIVYVLDYNNRCIKSYSDKLEWIYTYRPSVFNDNIPLSIAVHKSTNSLYVLTKDKIYIIQNRTNTIISTLNISNISSLVPKKIFFDQTGEFFYVITSLSSSKGAILGGSGDSSIVFKYTALGLYMDFLEIPKQQYNTGKSGLNRSIFLATDKAIVKCQEITDIVITGEGLDTEYWTDDQVLVKPDEMVQDLVINRVFSRLCQNIVTFKNSLESKLELTEESTPAGIITYFRSYPVSSNERPNLGYDVENNTVEVGVNEIHSPSVLNREFKKIYDSLLQIKYFLDIETKTAESEIGKNLDKCNSAFCWSWKAMSTYNLKRPMIRTCNINPISFRELTTSFTSTYTQTKNWSNATSSCCSNVKTPI